ncbi:MAG: CgeB family protein [Thermoplasmata archaeon]
MIIGMDLKYNAEFFYKKAFEKLGQEIFLVNEYDGVKRQFFTRILHTRTKIFNFTLGKLPINRNIMNIIKRTDPDHILIFKGELISDENLKKISESYNLSLFYPDTFRFKPILKNRLEYFKVVFTAANRTEFYKKLGAKRIVTVPWACDPDFHRNLNIQKIYDLSFIGSWYPNRARLLKKLHEVYIFGPYWRKRKNVFPAVYGEEYVKVINQTKINLNIHHNADIKADAPNMRTFEISGCGGFQISNYMPAIREYFPIMPTFNDPEELIELVKYYMDISKKDRDNEIDEIGLKMQNICYEKFKYTDSAKKILTSF